MMFKNDDIILERLENKYKDLNKEFENVTASKYSTMSLIEHALNNGTVEVLNETSLQITCNDVKIEIIPYSTDCYEVVFKARSIKNTKFGANDIRMKAALKQILTYYFTKKKLENVRYDKMKVYGEKIFKDKSEDIEKSGVKLSTLFPTSEDTSKSEDIEKSDTQDNSYNVSERLTQLLDTDLADLKIKYYFNKKDYRNHVLLIQNKKYKFNLEISKDIHGRYNMISHKMGEFIVTQEPFITGCKPFIEFLISIGPYLNHIDSCKLTPIFKGDNNSNLNIKRGNCDFNINISDNSDANISMMKFDKKLYEVNITSNNKLNRYILQFINKLYNEYKKHEL